jgi:hypothetical protein
LRRRLRRDSHSGNSSLKWPSYNLRRLLVLQVVAACALGIWQWHRMNTPEQRRARFIAEWEQRLSELPKQVGNWRAEPLVDKSDPQGALLLGIASWRKVYKLADDVPIYAWVAVGHPRDIRRHGSSGCYYTVLSEEVVDFSVSMPDRSAEALLSRVTPSSLRKSMGVSSNGVSDCLVARSYGDGWQASPLPPREAYTGDQIGCLLVIVADEPAHTDDNVARAETKERMVSLAALLMPEIQKLAYEEP